MQNTATAGNNGANGASQDEMDVLTLATAVVRYRLMIVRNCLVACILFFLLALIWPRTYIATTSILPPDSNDAEGLSLLLNSTPLAGLAVPAARSSSELFAEILRSRSVGAGVLHHELTVDSAATTLLDYWGRPKLSKALRRLYDRTTIATTEQGIITIEMEMERPDLAAQVATAFVAELDRVNRDKSTSRAKNSRIYIEQQLQITHANLGAAADSLRRFEERHRAVALPDQMRAAIEAVAGIKGTLVAKKVQLEVMQQTMRAANPAILQLQAEIRELQKQCDDMQYGAAGGGGDYFPVFSEVPQIGQRLAELTREVKVQETIWELLNQQYYQAKIQEARDTPTVQVLDPAVPPEQHASPKRVLMVVVGTTVVFLFSFLVAIIRHHASQMPRDTSEFQQWRSLLATLNDDWRLMRRRLGRRKQMV